MILRPRQEEFVKKSVVALQTHGNTLGIAPTGAGKTILFSAVTGKIINKKQKALILAHRDELTWECPIPCVNLIFFKFCLNNFIKN